MPAERPCFRDSALRGTSLFIQMCDRYLPLLLCQAWWRCKKASKKKAVRVTQRWRKKTRYRKKADSICKHTSDCSACLLLTLTCLRSRAPSTSSSISFTKGKQKNTTQTAAPSPVRTYYIIFDGLLCLKCKWPEGWSACCSASRPYGQQASMVSHSRYDRRPASS